MKFNIFREIVIETRVIFRGRNIMRNMYNLYQIDSFTKEKLKGNPAGVITNADGLTEIEMQKIARELNNEAVTQPVSLEAPRRRSTQNAHEDFEKRRGEGEYIDYDEVP